MPRLILFLLLSQGGMKAVVWTDVFQSVVMIAGLLAIMIQVMSITKGARALRGYFGPSRAKN